MSYTPVWLGIVASLTTLLTLKWNDEEVEQPKTLDDCMGDVVSQLQQSAAHEVKNMHKYRIQDSQYENLMRS